MAATQSNPKRVCDSQVEMTELVLPNHCNELGNLMGGQNMHWMDIACAMAAIRHTGHTCVTAGVDEISFFEPIRLGDIVVLKASVNRAFNTSMEIGVKVFRQSRDGEFAHSNSAYFTFVGLDENQKVVPAPPISPETQEEKRRYEAALFRRDSRLEKRKTLRQWKEQKK